MLAFPLMAQAPKMSDRWNLGVKGFTDKKVDAKPTAPLRDQRILLREAVPGCSVPLLKAEIPADVDYKIQVVPVDPAFTDGMPKLQGSPACQPEP